MYVVTCEAAPLVVGEYNLISNPKVFHHRSSKRLRFQTDRLSTATRICQRVCRAPRLFPRVCVFLHIINHRLRAVGLFRLCIVADWKYRFINHINDVLLVVLRPGPVKYSEILDLERRLRDCAMPKGLEIPSHGSLLDGLPEDAVTMRTQRYIALISRETGIFVSVQCRDRVA